MKTVIVVCAALAAATALGGCKKAADGSLEFAGAQHQKGRYQGAGVYTPGDAWRQLNDVQQSNGVPKTANDQAIIVVVDSDTGELRACGDLSGYCVGMNPWSKDLMAAQKSPVAVTPVVVDDAAASTTAAADKTPAKHPTK